MKNIQITYGRTSSDCTSEYYIRLKKPMTVKEFIDERLEAEREWGEFKVWKEGKNYYEFPCVEYKHGKLLGNQLEPYYEMKIKEVNGSGGWSRSDFVFICDEGDKE